MAKTKQSIELEHLLALVADRAYQPLGILFFDPKLKMFGIAEVSGAPSSLIEAVGARIGGGKDTIVWTELGVRN